MFQLSVVSVPVTDQEKARSFYEDTLDFKFLAEGDRGSEFAWILMAPPSGIAGITLVRPNARQAAGSAQGLILQTLDLDRFVERYAARGLALAEVTTASWGRFSIFQDPDGNGWIIAEAKLVL